MGSYKEANVTIFSIVDYPTAIDDMKLVRSQAGNSEQRF